MPPKALAALAKRAGKSLRDAERYWREAKRDAEKRAAAGEIYGDKYQYAMGVVKARLGLESVDLVLAGIHPKIVVEGQVPGQVVPEQDVDSFSRKVIAAVIPQFYKVDKFGRETHLVIPSRDGAKVSEEAVRQLEEAMSDEEVLQLLRKLIPNVPDVYLRQIVGSPGSL